MLQSNKDLRDRLHQEIDTAEAQNRITPDIMYLVEAVKEIERLNEALSVCGQRVEDLFNYINERSGEKIAVIKAVPRKS